jgi:hypothetical protein
MHMRWHHQVGSVAVAVAVAIGSGSGCSGGEGGGGPAGSPDGLPRFVSELQAACTDGAGFGGAAAYEAGDDPYPFALLQGFDDLDGYFVADSQLPEGRAAAELSNPDDADEQARLAEISVVGCYDVVAGESSGATCEYEADDGGDPIVLDVQDATAEVTLHETATGEVIDTVELELSGADYECPIVASIDDSQTTMLPSVDAETLDEAIAAVLG